MNWQAAVEGIQAQGVLLSPFEKLLQVSLHYEQLVNCEYSH